MAVKFIISMVFAILVAIFAIQNSSNVTINFLFAEFSISQALVILISAIVGAIIVMILATVTQIRLNLKLKTSTKTISRLEEENKLLSSKVMELVEKHSADSPQPEAESTDFDIENEKRDDSLPR